MAEATTPFPEEGQEQGQEEVPKEYQCKFCDVKMATHYQMNSHMRVHKGLTKSNKPGSSTFTTSKKAKNFTKLISKNGETLYKCNICKKKLTTHFQLNSHLRVHKLSKKESSTPVPLPIIVSDEPPTTEAKNRFDCKLCDKKMTNRFQHNSHMQIHKNKVFKKPTALPLPIKIHSKNLKFGMAKKRYQCKFCDVKMATHYQLNSHMRVHKVKNLDSSTSTPDPPQLPPPGNVSPRNQNRKDYHSLHHGPPLKISSRRNSSTDTHRSSSVSVEKEVAQVGKTLKVSPIKMEKSKIFKCKICGEVMRNQNHLNWHMRVHKTKTPEQEGQQEEIQVTPRNVDSLFSLLTQKRVHDGPLYFSPVRLIRIKPFRCSKCPYSANASLSLNLHVRLFHEGVTPHPCGFCWKSFPNRERLEEHLRDHDDFSGGFQEQNGINENGVMAQP